VVAIASAVIASAAIEAAAAAAIKATTAAAIKATTAATAIASSPSAASCLRGRHCPAHQNRRGAGDVDEQQSQCCEAAGQDIVAFSHSIFLPVTSNIWTSALSHLDVWESF